MFATKIPLVPDCAKKCQIHFGEYQTPCQSSTLRTSKAMACGMILSFVSKIKVATYFGSMHQAAGPGRKMKSPFVCTSAMVLWDTLALDDSQMETMFKGRFLHLKDNSRDDSINTSHLLDHRR
eukprot:5126604-Amphidinium_carterae.1